MNITSFIKKAEQLTKQHYQRITSIYLFVEILLLAINLIPNQVIAILLGIVVTTIPHAYVLTSLKLIDEKADDISFKDCLIGIKDFARLFPSYIMRKISLNMVSFIVLFPAVSIIRFKTGFAIGEFLDWIRMIVVSGMDDLAGLSTVQAYLTSLPMIISLCLSTILTAIFSYGLAMVPYLVQEYEVSWTESILKSWRMMKKHKMELFLLKMYYLPRVIVIYLLLPLILSILSFSMPLAICVSMVLSIYLPIIFYLPQTEIATALFYKELIKKEQHADLFEL